MTVHIDWKQLENSERLPAGDQITLKISDYDEDDVTQFRLRAGGAVNWWKGIEIKNSGGQVVAWCESTAPQIGVAEIEWDDIEGGKIILWKAGVFGIHTPYYDLDVDDHIKEKKLVFRWTADR
ncbi:hypothetical protein Aple_020830 [Acrocarpospora pleiomorpha]|uniref:Uncharacterized protein n=1 Tax=Acrocarpospora pleiomorpha TaxID=90975 RepID=A0A5M3XBY7_9ACTN|nr:hypothetical protein [Acrocarpospora pleiomorpha]GES19187.1 hypothetical protein Aple_020830 [Acrocarpospora pleiomorpha]